LASVTFCRVQPHPRISINSICSLYQPLGADIAMWADLGVGHVGLCSTKLEEEGWDQGLAMVREAGLRVSNIATENHVIADSLRFAAAVGAPTVYLCTGPASSPSWDESVESFCAVMSPLITLAGQLGVRLAVEPTLPLRTHRSFVLSLRDAFDLAHALGIAVVADINSCWYERQVDDQIRQNVESLALVQISDYVIGTFDSPNRAVPGEGDIPLTRLISTLLDAGYKGSFDLEIIGPRIEEEGYASAIRRSLEWTTALLDQLGA
jgi:sugar phosphate isomerase/epimerase